MRILLILALLTTAASAQWVKGFNFRSTAGCATDSGNNIGVYQGASDWDQNRSGLHFGFSPALGVADAWRQNCAGEDRLRGYVFAVNSGSKKFDLTITPGQYKIYLALGNWASASAWEFVAVYDGLVVDDTDPANALFTVDGGTSAPDNYVDATGATMTRAAWIAAGAGNPVTVTFTTSTLHLVIGGGDSVSGSNATHLAHMTVEQVGGGASATRKRVVVIQ